MLLNKKLASYKTKEYIQNEYFDIISCCDQEEIIDPVCILLKIQKYFPNIVQLNKNEYSKEH